MSKRENKSKGKSRSPIVLEDLLPAQDVHGGDGKSVVFGVLSADETSKQRKPKKRN